MLSNMDVNATDRTRFVLNDHGSLASPKSFDSIEVLCIHSRPAVRSHLEDLSIVHDLFFDCSSSLMTSYQ
jgi:hypothetical protein